MIYKIGIISKRYVIMFGILRWHVQLSIVWSQIVHQVCSIIALACMIYEFSIISKPYELMFPLALAWPLTLQAASAAGMNVCG